MNEVTDESLVIFSRGHLEDLVKELGRRFEQVNAREKKWMDFYEVQTKALAEANARIEELELGNKKLAEMAEKALRIIENKQKLTTMLDEAAQIIIVNRKMFDEEATDWLKRYEGMKDE